MPEEGRDVAQRWMCVVGAGRPSVCEAVWHALGFGAGLHGVEPREAMVGSAGEEVDGQWLGGPLLETLEPEVGDSPLGAVGGGVQSGGGAGG